MHVNNSGCAEGSLNNRQVVNVALIGGMDRLGRHYIEEAGRAGVNLRVFSQAEGDIASKIKNLDALVIFTNKISHKAKRIVTRAAKSGNITVLMSHSCGVCSLKKCIDCLVNMSYSSSQL